MMAQVTAASLVAEIRVLAHPASTGSITTSGNKEDFVSMGMTAAVKLQRVVRDARYVLAIEALCAARALDLLAPLETSPELEHVRDRIRVHKAAARLRWIAAPPAATAARVRPPRARGASPPRHSRGAGDRAAWPRYRPRCVSPQGTMAVVATGTPSTYPT
jgi:hypothetical protein